MGTQLHGRHLLTFDTWDRRDIDLVLEVAHDLKRRFALGEITELLKHKTLFMIFYEPSTRTRNSLEAAMTQLGGHAHDLTPSKLQLAHGESPKDTARVLSRMGEAIAVRICFYQVGHRYLQELAEYATVPVISMQDDVYHPLQVIADVMTLQEHFGRNLRGLKVAITWAYATTHAKPLSVPQSQILLFPRYGMDVVVAHPPEFPLQRPIVERAHQHAQAHGTRLEFVDSMEDAVRDADVVIPKNWGGFAYFDDWQDSEEQYREMQAHLEKYRHWTLTPKIFSLARPHARIMHALPADRGHEVTDDLLDGPHSIIYDEAENRLHTAKAVLALTLGGRG